MKKFAFDIVEIIKDFWAAFVWLVQAADEIGDKIDERLNKDKPVTAELKHATIRVKRSCVMTQD